MSVLRLPPISPHPWERRISDRSGPLARLLQEKALRPVFQPIASMKDGGIYAHEALIRGPAGTPLHMPDALFAAARVERLTLQLEIACVVAALDRWGELRQSGRLFVNLSAAALMASVTGSVPGVLLQTIRARGLEPRMLVVELTEHEPVEDVGALAAVVREMHAAGVMLALDDFGDGHSSLRLWSELEPDIVKIDKYFIHDLSQHAKKIQTLRALMQIAKVFGTTLVAEGIETAEDLRVIRDLGLELGQGYLLGFPLELPCQKIDEAAASVFADPTVSVMPAQRDGSVSSKLQRLQPIIAPTLSPRATHNDLATVFEKNPGLHAVAIVENELPVGLIDRKTFMELSARRYFKELYGAKACTTFANMSPRVIERMNVARDLLGILTSQDQRYLTEGFIVTDNGRYVGLGTGDQLVRSVTESRIEAARHANPLTFLPGNIPITEHIERLLASGSEFVACYGDLADFKPFNDYYGYWRGDEMIRLCARMTVTHCDALRDFVGHVGGDDFIMLFQSSDWQQRCEAMIAEFNRSARLLYDDAARDAGGIAAQDRHGVDRFFSFTTLSIGAVRVLKAQYPSAESVANAAAAAKHEAKAAPGGLWVLGGSSTAPSNG